MDRDAPEMIDSHAHLYLKEFKDDIEMVLERGRHIGLSKVYTPNIDSTTIDAMLDLNQRFPDLCIPMMGLHPCSVNENVEKELALVEEWLHKKDFAAVGEIGTDLYWDKTFWKEQQHAFKTQIEFARRLSKPVVIHCRETLDQTIAMVEQLQDGTLTGVFHCFTGNDQQAKRITDLGFFLGIGGVVTFKNGGLDKQLVNIDLQHLLLETDSPYLAPTPNRGKRNEPLYLQLIAQRIADIKGVAVEAVMDITTANTRKLFENHELPEN